MVVKFGYSKDFSELLSQLEKKYGSQIIEIEGFGTNLDIDNFNKKFFSNTKIGDVSIDSNANVRSKHIGTYFSEISKPFTKLNSIYVIWKELKKLHGKETADKFVEYQINGAIYLHDAHHSAYNSYCFAYTLQPIVEKGLPFIDTIQSTPAKHLTTFIQHVIQFVMFASNQTSGAVGLPDFFVWMWYFVKKDLEDGVIPEDKLDWYIEQHFQILTYSFNQPIRTNQSPYTNFTYLDRNYIKAIFEGEKYPDGTPIVDETENIIKLQKHYWEWTAKERERQMFTFPVLTATLLYKDDKFVDEDSARFINRVNMKWQDTNWYISDSVDAVASCCRLTSSTKNIKLSLSPVSGENESEKLSGMANSVGGSDLNIGSFKVVTINLPRIALESNSNKDKFMKILIERIDIVQKVLHIIRNILKERIEQGVLPLYNVGLMKLERQYGTIGITGVWEAADFMGLTELTAEGLKYSLEGEQFISEILDLIRKKAEEGFKKYKFTFNIEQVPAEKAAVTLAEKDKLLFGEDKQPYKLYSNQWIPLIADADMMNRIRYSGKWDKKVSGGAILHINIGAPFKNEEESWKIVNLIAKKGVMYFAFNQKISTCENGHAFIGNKCPVCGKNKVEEYIRIVGYLVPSGAFNKTRREFEYNKRKFYTLEGVES
jgi:ribonucleoside-triphosphate reductase